MKKLISDLEFKLGRLATATDCLEPSKASEVARSMARSALGDVRILGAQYDDLPAHTASTPEPPPTYSHPVEPVDCIIFYDMAIYRIKSQDDRGWILSEDILYGDRIVRNLDNETFPMSMFGLQTTLFCSDQYKSLVKDRPRLNTDDIRERLSGIWFTIMSNENQPETRMQAQAAFKSFVDTVETKANALEETTVDGVTVFNS